MAAKQKHQEKEPQESKPESADNKILTLSQFSKLTDEEKQAFREANGTVTND